MRALVAATLLLAGCAAPAANAPPPPAYDREPSYANPLVGPATGLEFVAQLKDDAGNPFPSAGGNFVFGDYVFSSGLNAGFFIADIHDPEHPVLVYNSTADTPTPFARKADLIAHPDGRRTLVLATQGNGMHFWNVTDVHHPEWASFLEFDRNHNVIVLPGTEYVFNNPSTGRGAANTLIDAHDPYDPVILGDYGTYGCHGTTVRGLAGTLGSRAYCAAIDRTEVWNLEGFDASAHDFGIKLELAIEGVDSPIVGSPALNPPIPSNPLGISSLPTRNLHHFATANEDGTILIIGDEHRGGGNPGACLAHDEATGASTPLGAVWFYDISNPADPLLLSWISPPTVMPEAPTTPSQPPADPTAIPATALNSAYTAVPNCTAHFGTVVPGEEKLVIAWYSAGVLLIDFTDPSNPSILSQYQTPDINAWNARVSNGYVFTGDINRGMDVLKLV